MQFELWRELTYMEYSNKIPSTSNKASITPYLSLGFENILGRTQELLSPFIKKQ
jgi:hypothetical protein